MSIKQTPKFTIEIFPGQTDLQVLQEDTLETLARDFTAWVQASLENGALIVEKGMVQWSHQIKEKIDDEI